MASANSHQSPYRISGPAHRRRASSPFFLQIWQRGAAALPIFNYIQFWWYELETCRAMHGNIGEQFRRPISVSCSWSEAARYSRRYEILNIACILCFYYHHLLGQRSGTGEYWPNIFFRRILPLQKG